MDDNAMLCLLEKDPSGTPIGWPKLTEPNSKSNDCG